MNQVVLPVCEGLLLDLCGYRDFPTVKDASGQFIGLGPFARALQEVSVSVEHARAIVATFEEKFPTVKEIRITGNNTREKFDGLSETSRQELERLYGKPEPVKLDFTPNLSWQDEHQVMCQKVAKVIDQARIKRGQKVRIWYDRTEWLKTKQELGYELNRYELAELEGRLPADISRMA